MERSQAQDVPGRQVGSQADQLVDNLEVIAANPSKHLLTLLTLGSTTQPVGSHNHLEDAGDFQEAFSHLDFLPDFLPGQILQMLLESLEISAVVDFEPRGEMLVVTGLEVQPSPPVEEENSAQVVGQLQWSLRSLSQGEDRFILPADDRCNLLGHKLFAPPPVFIYNNMNY